MRLAVVEEFLQPHLEVTAIAQLRKMVDETHALEALLFLGQPLARLAQSLEDIRELGEHHGVGGAHAALAHVAEEARTRERMS